MAQVAPLPLLLLLAPASAFLYQPGSPSGNIVSEGKPGMGEIWDPSVTWWRGKWYAHAMYQEPGLRTNVYESGWLATSKDGCHWEDGGPVAAEHPGDMWWKGFVRQIRGDAANTTDDALFIMDHGVFENGKNDALRFLTSTDLKNWVENSTSHPNRKWYNTRGRWDHMYMSADKEQGGFIGFAVSSPSVKQPDGTPYGGTWPGINRSPDGITWTQHAPLNVSWDGVGPTGIEEGGFEQIKGLDGSNKFYLIGGGGGPAGTRDAYSMWAFSSDKIDGPYSPVQDGYRISGGGAGGGSGRFGWLAAWCGPHCDGTADGTPLISNYITPGRSARADVWMLPMRQPIVDQKGRLRLGYFKANDQLQKSARQINATTSLTCGGSIAQDVAWLGGYDAIDHSGGVVIKFNLTASGVGSVGITLEDMGTSANRSYMPQTDLAGGDYRYMGVNYSDPRLCEQSCDADAACLAWTYVSGKPATEPYPVPRCCLKNGTGLAPRPNPSCTSGFKASPPGPSSGRTSLLVTVGADGDASSAAELHRVDSAGKPTLIDSASRFKCGPTKECGVATVTGVAAAEPHAVLLMFRKGMFEAYVDDLLVQSFVYGGAYPLPSTGHGRVGIACKGTAAVKATGAKSWAMEL
jgi:hypothetical protein